jgi:hypothetical protein
MVAIESLLPFVMPATDMLPVLALPIVSPALVVIFPSSVSDIVRSFDEPRPIVRAFDEWMTVAALPESHVPEIVKSAAVIVKAEFVASTAALMVRVPLPSESASAASSITPADVTALEIVMAPLALNEIEPVRLMAALTVSDVPAIIDNFCVPVLTVTALLTTIVVVDSRDTSEEASWL